MDMATPTVLKCERCGAEWEPRKANPIQCPRCKSLYWNRPRKQDITDGKAVISQVE